MTQPRGPDAEHWRPGGCGEWTWVEVFSIERQEADLYLKRVGLFYLVFLILLLFGASGVVALSGAPVELVEHGWSGDQRSLAPTTEGLEAPGGRMHDLSGIPQPGELLGEWSWSSLGILGHYCGAGIAINYPYLYLSNQEYSRIYWLDISTVPPSDPHYVIAPHAPWGAGMDNDANLWFGAPSVHYDYEYNADPPTLSWTGRMFFNNQASDWMADISDNYPGDTIFQLGVGLPSAAYSNDIYGFHEPSGTPVRHFGHETWSYISQRGLTYNPDNGTFVVGGWNSGKVWEISCDDGTPIREFVPSATQISGLAYQEEVYVGVPRLWIQNNSHDDLLQLYEWTRIYDDDIAAVEVSYPHVQFVDDGPLEVRGKVANVGEEPQEFSTWCEVDFSGIAWISTPVLASLDPFTTAEFTYEVFPNGLSPGTVLDISINIDNLGDLDFTNNRSSSSFIVVRSCTAYVTDRYPEWGNVFYYHDYETIFAKKMETDGTRQATMVWIAINTASKGEAYYPWPDPVYDQVMLGCWVDDDLDGKPDSEEPAWADTVTPTDAHWVAVEVPECSFLSTGGIWVGYKNLNPGREALVVDPYPRQHNDCWYYHPYYEDWKPYSGYSDFHIRGCLEYPPLVNAAGLDQLDYDPPSPWIQEEYTSTLLSLKLCGHVDGQLSAGNLIHQSLPVAIRKENVVFAPETFTGDMSDTAEVSMMVSIPVGQHEGRYEGNVYINHQDGTEEIPFGLTVGVSSDLDIQDYGGNLEGNVMHIMGVRDGIAIGTFNAVNPNSWDVNFDQHDGPGNSDLTDISWLATNLHSGSDSLKDSIPSSAVQITGLAPQLSSGQGNFGVVAIRVPSDAKHWHQQYDYGYSGKVTVSGLDPDGGEVSDEFAVYLMVLKSHEGSGLCFWGEHEGGANVIHWSNLGLSESGYALYRNGAKITELVGQYHYVDRVSTGAVYEYELGVKVGGSEILIGPIAVGGKSHNVFSLSQSYPNPASDRTTLRFSVAESGDVTIAVYNPAGMLVGNIVEQQRYTPGVYTVTWNDMNLASGVYFIRMNAGDFSVTRKMTVVR